MTTETETEIEEQVERLNAKLDRLTDWGKKAHENMALDPSTRTLNAGTLAAHALGDCVRRELVPMLGDDFEVVRETKQLIAYLEGRARAVRANLRGRGLLP